ncbi:MAG TPA: hypothetical protein ENK57_10200 [Polyangiaceae bacterium]|nr:hypothetical protein [Polyangiaceae bacterium]
MSHTITCPSRLTGRIRGMKVREERVLADRKLAKSGGQGDALLAACWEQTLYPGPYDFGDKDTDWARCSGVIAFSWSSRSARSPTGRPTPSPSAARVPDPLRVVLLPPGGRAPFPPAREGADDQTAGPEQLLARPSLEGWREEPFQLCWRPRARIHLRRGGWIMLRG